MAPEVLNREDYSNNPRGNETRFVPHTVSRFIGGGKLNRDERSTEHKKQQSDYRSWCAPTDQTENDTTDETGTKRYMAPEVLNREDYSNTADVCGTKLISPITGVIGPRLIETIMMKSITQSYRYKAVYGARSAEPRGLFEQGGRLVARLRPLRTPHPQPPHLRTSAPTSL